MLTQIHQILIIDLVTALGLFTSLKYLKSAVMINTVIIILVSWMMTILIGFSFSLLAITCPLLLINSLLFVFIHRKEVPKHSHEYGVMLKTHGKDLRIENIKRGVSIIGSAGSGKTESVVYNFLRHFSQNGFCGIIHDYKDFELTEIAYPLFKNSSIPFYIVSMEKTLHRVNPIAPKYLENEESVNEIARVLLENLLEQKESGAVGTSKFFNDAAEGLISGLIWKLKTSYPQYCTLPHLISIYQYLDTDSLIAFLETNSTSRAMADAFISGKDSDRQTAGVKSTLSNALKRISTRRIFMTLSADEIPLDINDPENPAVVALVNNPKYDASYSPVIAAVIHTVIKQMSARHRNRGFLLIEEAPTVRLLNMHRIPATLRSYNIATIYVMQDKIQNDMMYGDKASKAILSNLSYQFFGKVNDPDTAKYYERFFEIVRRETTSINRGYNLDFDTRITTGEKEIPKIRADEFFRLRQGEFITYADGIDRKVQFQQQRIEKYLPVKCHWYTQAEMEENYNRILLEVKSIFQ